MHALRKGLIYLNFCEGRLSLPFLLKDPNHISPYAPLRLWYEDRLLVPTWFMGARLPTSPTATGVGKENVDVFLSNALFRKAFD